MKTKTDLKLLKQLLDIMRLYEYINKLQLYCFSHIKTLLNWRVQVRVIDFKTKVKQVPSNHINDGKKS